MAGSLSEKTSRSAKIDIQSDTKIDGAIAKALNKDVPPTKEHILIEYKEGHLKTQIYEKGQESQAKNIVFEATGIKGEIKRESNQVSIQFEKIKANYSIFDSHGKLITGERVTISKYRVEINHRYTCSIQVAQSDKYKSLSTFPTHGFSHIRAVCNRSEKVANLISGNNEDVKLYTRIAAEVHDTGMGGLPRLGANIEKDGSGTLKEFKDGNQIRKEHSINSGVEVLRNTNSFKEMGIHSGMVALTAASHSKSNSGIYDMNNVNQWKTLSDKIEATCNSIAPRMNTYEVDEMKEGIADMRSMFIFNGSEWQIASGRENDFETLKMSAISVTIGDALSHTAGTGEGFEAQNGDTYKFSNIPEGQSLGTLIDCLNNLSNKVANKQDISDMASIETKDIQQDFVNPQGEVVRTDIMDGIKDVSAAFCLGESNIKYMPPEAIESGGIRLEAHILDITTCPISTIMNGLTERVLEGVRLDVPVEYITKIDNTNFDPQVKEGLEEMVCTILRGNLDNYVDKKYEAEMEVGDRLRANVTIK